LGGDEILHNMIKILNAKLLIPPFLTDNTLKKREILYNTEEPNILVINLCGRTFIALVWNKLYSKYLKNIIFLRKAALTALT
jgi:hypothetical protein